MSVGIYRQGEKEKVELFPRGLLEVPELRRYRRHRVLVVADCDWSAIGE